MRAEIKKTAAPTAARKHNRQSESYRNSVSESRAKLQIGELLLFLQTPLNQIQKRKYWRLFEVRLSEYLDLRFCEVAI